MAVDNFWLLFVLQAAVRSSRRKRNQYVQSLRDHVTDLKKRKRDATDENRLLKQLSNLWQRLCTEVEAEIKAAKRDSTPSSTTAKTLQPPSTPVPPLIPLDNNTPIPKRKHTKGGNQTSSPKDPKQEEKMCQNTKNDSSSLVFVVLPPPPHEAGSNQNEEQNCHQISDEIDREVPRMSFEVDDYAVSPPSSGDEIASYELQLEDEVVPLLISPPKTPEEETYNNGRDYVKIAPRHVHQHKQQRIFLLKAPEVKMVKGVWSITLLIPLQTYLFQSPCPTNLSNPFFAFILYLQKRTIHPYSKFYKFEPPVV